MTVPDTAFRRAPGPVEPVTLSIDEGALATLRQLQGSYGNIVSFSTPRGRQVCFVNDPDAVHGILVKNHSKYVKGPGFDRVKLLVGNGFLVSDGAAWRRSRTMAQPGFSRQSMHRLNALIARCSQQRIERWSEYAEAGEPINMTKEMTDFALEVILRAIFGEDYDVKIMKSGENPFAFLSEDSARDLNLVLKLRSLREFVLSIVTERRHGEPGDNHDFLSAYLSAEDKTGQKFSDRELLDELMTLLVAGFETSAGTLNWAWYLIARHPDVDEKIFQEAQECIPDIDAINSESVSNLKYLHQVLNETMRLYPPVWLFSRRAIHNDSIGDFDATAGTDIYISPFILQRTEQFWPEPDRFDPDRFAIDKTERKGKTRKSAFVPFSLGPRRCIGEYFSLSEMKIHLALLMQKFRMDVTNDAEPALDLGINLRAKEDIYLRPTLRRPS